MHAPLELLARAALLPSAPHEVRTTARMRIANIAAVYAPGDEIDPPGRSFSTTEEATAALITALRKHDPNTADAAVVATPDPIRGSVPKAVVVLRERAARDGIELALLQHVRESLAGYKCPRRLEIARALPRDGSGAIDRTALVVC